MLRTTPLHDRTAPLNQGRNWRRWAGFTVASSYELSHDREYFAIRNSAALLDVSPLFKYHIAGRDAARLLDRVVTRDVGRTQVGQVLYTPWCDARGKVIDDGTVARLAEHSFRLTSAEPNLRWLGDNARRLDVRIEDVSDRTAALALQGPSARVILERAVERDLAAVQYFRLTTGQVRGRDVTITRTGYTGDLGYEIWMDATDAIAVWDALIEAGTPYGIVPCGILALDMARIEAGLLLLDVDYVSSNQALIDAQMSTPLELSLDWTVAFDKPQFNGRLPIRAERERGPEWRFVGVEVDWVSLEDVFTSLGLAPRLPTQAWRTSVPLYDANGIEQIGYATSGCWSPLLKKYLTLAHVEARYSSPDTPLQIEVTVEHRRRRAQAAVRRLPFFNPERKRA
ncbi:MAG: Aminomethyltransferase [Gemmatimonadaceae bacterium]|nr:Aminomethyltransferase [Gemmatimonadaceae bacterium]